MNPICYLKTSMAKIGSIKLMEQVEHEQERLEV